ncbi:creatine testis isozyme-like protein [Labeo rohita]|uniref:creatine kinase n=1 Tax=Labeo rohita TaxID=84645 RepID=A0A498MUS8_LABRO|nr:creatine testis isozyme-like protein [Labeo rohita]RXN33210.1 creatine testis isozyme-like protein [Labeo rohita]
MSRFNLKRGSPKDEFPNLDRNHTVMGQILNLHMYTRQFNRATESGVIFDDIIRPGLEDPGQSTGTKAVGCLAGDAQSYILFCDFFDRVIESYHGYKITSNAVQESDFNYDNLKGGDDFDQAYALSCEVTASRSIEDYSFPTHCSRGERRELLTLAEKVLEQLGEDLPGKLYSIDELSHENEGRSVVMDSPPLSLIKIGVARDWPDSRALWLMETLYKKLRHPFIWKPHLGWVVSSPAEVGTGLKASVTVRLLHVAENKRLDDILDRLRLQMEATGCPGIYKISNLQTIGFNEVELTQLVVDGVKLLIRMEKRLENNGGIDDLVPTQK